MCKNLKFNLYIDFAISIFANTFLLQGSSIVDCFQLKMSPDMHILMLSYITLLF